MDEERRSFIRKALLKKDVASLSKISKDELIKYIQDSQILLLNATHDLISNI